MTPLCPTTTPLPPPPTPHPACAVPLGGSNSTILDTCCNGHINAIISYGSSSASSAEQQNCYQYCTPDPAKLHDVYACLERPENLDVMDGEGRKWACWGEGGEVVVRGVQVGGGSMRRGGRMGWVGVVVLGMVGRGLLGGLWV
ncbi:hypothetical protein M011DRAFT_504084 [Sporormia fimetaria CBS 119925]|uniref:Uncharacterized protein n=1 Tax=Sporormia fimetaria CBS 119925 TaxID=1340428 RepID=A0A6A6V8J2_9PLEO|nr:hypothetical protein M011DRAFT_504084 [Sporormia fimetaria CBS 119925]